MISKRDRNHSLPKLDTVNEIVRRSSCLMAFLSAIKTVSQLSKRRSRYRWNYWQMALVTLLVVLVSYIPLQLMVTSIQVPQPQAIFTLGGRPAREEFTAEFARNRPALKVWISSGMAKSSAIPLFTAVGIDPERVKFDFQATDTVTNFTSLVDEFEQFHIRHVYLITSDFHMARARAIAAIVFGSRGILTTPISVPSDASTESPLRITRDVFRSLIWLVSRRTGASLRFRHLSAQEGRPYALR